MSKTNLKRKFRIARTYIGKPEDSERLVEVALRLLRLGTQPKKAKKAA